MEEQRENTPQQPPETPAPAAPQEAGQGSAAEPKAAQPQDRSVTLEVVLNGETTRKSVKFNTALLLKEVQALDDAATVTVTARPEQEGMDPPVLLAGTKKKAEAVLAQSVVKPEQLVAQFQHLVRFLVDHSTLKAVGVELICTDDKGDTAGAGFVSTTEDCTIAQAVALVNCGDANLDEFVTKAKLDIPGRGGAGAGKTIITPTPEQVRKLG